MQYLRTIIILIILLNFNTATCQDYRGLFVHAEYQFLRYNFYQIGLGFNPKNHLIEISRKKEKYSFIGYTLSYSNHFKNADWGLAFQTVAYSGTYDGPLGLGIELNLKNVSKQNHFGIRPMIGFSFPVWSVMYSYNFDLYHFKPDRINQHEITLGMRLRVFKWR